MLPDGPNFYFDKRTGKWTQYIEPLAPGESLKRIEWRNTVHFVDGQCQLSSRILSITYNHFKNFGSLRSLVAKIGFSYRTFKHWQKKYYCFREAIELGIAKSMDWLFVACFSRGAGMSEDDFRKEFGTDLPSAKNLLWFGKLHQARINKFFKEEKLFKDEIFGECLDQLQVPTNNRGGEVHPEMLGEFYDTKMDVGFFSKPRK